MLVRLRFMPSLGSDGPASSAKRGGRFDFQAAAGDRKLGVMKLAPTGLCNHGFIMCALLVSSVCARSAAVEPDSLSLAGKWRFQLDRADAGVTERWFDRSLGGRIKLPGALQNQGFGDDITVETRWMGETKEQHRDLF